MFERILNWFDDDGVPTASATGSGSVERAVAVLLVAAARADGEFAGDEARAVAQLVGERFQLTPEEIADLVAAAASENRRDLYPVARLLNETLTRDQREDVIGLMWRVVYSDGRLEAHEDALMHRVAKLLEIPHRELIARKLHVRREPGDGQ